MIEGLLREIKGYGATFAKIVDITHLSPMENRGFNYCILIGLAIDREYLRGLYKNGRALDKSIFKETEKRVDIISDKTSNFLTRSGYQAFAQTEQNLIKYNYYNSTTKSTVLPHKKVGMLSGIGWIGKNNLLVTRKYGNALCFCTVLVNAPLESTNETIKDSGCGTCNACISECPDCVLHNVIWSESIDRDEIVDVYNCSACLKCMIACPWTQKYLESE